LLSKRLDLNPEILKLVATLSFDTNGNTMAEWNKYLNTDSKAKLPRLVYILFVLKRLINASVNKSNSENNYIHLFIFKNGVSFILTLFIQQFQINFDFLSIKAIISLIKIISKLIGKYFIYIVNLKIHRLTLMR